MVFIFFMLGYYTNLYPYPFINVNRVGYENAFIAVIAIAVLFICLVLLLKAVEFIRLKLKYQIIHH